ncbi:hypothetical protein Q3G72_005980 [Acer saccharum]|nr:hypothetical protein Q3G72_005980 [Acer saccharum]
MENEPTGIDRRLERRLDLGRRIAPDASGMKRRFQTAARPPKETAECFFSCQLSVLPPNALLSPLLAQNHRISSFLHPEYKRQSTEETPQDHPEDFEGRKQRKGKCVMNEESREERDQTRTHGVNSSDTYQRNQRRHRSISSEDKSSRPRRELRSKRAWRRRFESTEDQRSPDDRGNYRRMTIKSRLDPAGEPTGQQDVTLQELSRKVSAMVRRYGRNVSSDDESDSPFVETIARTQFPDIFRMPTIEQYKENKDPKEHVHRFHNVMAQYSSNDGLLCLTFLQTFGNLASRWFGRLPPGSISSFSNLSKAFIRQFMGSVQRRKSLAHLSNLKQERNELIKKYLVRFGKVVAQIEDANDVAVIAAFTNGLQSGRLSFYLRRDRPKTYEEMMEIVGDYALAEEEEVAQGGSYVHGYKPDSKSEHKDDKKTQSRDHQRDEKGQKGHPRESRGNARANRFQGRYNHYTPLTNDQEEILSVLRDHIESLIRDGHLKDFALKEDKHGDCQDSRQGNGQDRKSPRRNSPNATINTIFGGPHTGRSNRERMSEVREVMYESRSMEINSVQRNPKKGREGHDPITFTAEDSDGIDAKPNDAIVVGVRIAHRDVLRVMIDNGSSTDILSARVYDELRLDRKDLEPFHMPLKGFGGAEVRSLGTVKLPVRFGTAPCQRKILLDFVVVDIHNWSYNALLGRPFLNKARAVTSTHALKIKFPTEFGV